MHTSDDPREGALREEIQLLRAALAQAEREALLDALTGCLNRRGWTACLRAEERRCARHGLDAVVVILDLDGLKAINDAEGHDAGDRRPGGCAAPLPGARPGGGLVARPGGGGVASLA